jgi:hypothetical protein
MEFVSKGILRLANRIDAGHIECQSKTCVPSFGEFLLAAEGAGLILGQIQAAVLQKLPMMCEASQVTTLGQNRQCDDRADAGNRLKYHIVRMTIERLFGLLLQLLAQGIELLISTQLQTKRLASDGVLGNG